MPVEDGLWFEQGAFVQILSAGQYIKHFQYGCGVITKSDADRTTIDFDIHGLKKFVTSLVAVEPAEGVPPKRSRTKRRKKAAPTTNSAVIVKGTK